MNAILGMTELVLDTPLTADQRAIASRQSSPAADNLLGLMNDLLDFSKIEAGKLELDPGDFFPAGGKVGDTLHALAMRAHQARGWSWSATCSPTCPDALVGDAARLRQVLLNLARQRHQVHRSRARWSYAWRPPATPAAEDGGRPPASW